MGKVNREMRGMMIKNKAFVTGKFHKKILGYKTFYKKDHISDN